MNILFLTTHFPSPLYDNKQTKMGLYYTREWVGSGHKVRVVHISDEFVTGYSELRSKLSKQPFNYEGVMTLELPAVRFIPRCTYISRGVCRRLARRTMRFLGSDSFTPSLIICDFPAVLWKVARTLSQKYNCRAVPLFHTCDLYNNISKNTIKSIWRDCDIVAVRSNQIGIQLKKKFNCTKPMYWAKSGVPSAVFNNGGTSDTSGKSTGRLIYIGSLIPRKKVDVIIKALDTLAADYSFTLDIIGEGVCRAELEKLAHGSSISDRVFFRGQRSREESLAALAESDCFIMVSNSETFGMVYVEAMASHCYVIGSRGEGIDGVLVHNINGVLVEPGNANALAAEIKRYFDMSDKMRERIIERAYEDSKKLTDAAVAAELLETAANA